jgi:glycosyltransferase involved in cell wall biosynthesis
MRIAALSAVRNEERHLESALDAVMRQTHPDFRLYVVDDNSTDTTPHILGRFAEADPRISIVQNVPGETGKVASFNRAYQAARDDGESDLVIFVHGDDLLPPDSFALRANWFASVGSDAARAVVLGKLKTMSSDPRRDGLVIPRGARGNPSGPTIALGMQLAEEVFPVSADLISEDLWIWNVARLRATHIGHIQDVVVHYRIHPGNTGPRSPDFVTASTALSRRYDVFRLLIAHQHRFAWTAYERDFLEQQSQLEQLRREGRTLALLTHRHAPLAARLRFASQSDPRLHRVRDGLWRLASGW